MERKWQAKVNRAIVFLIKAKTDMIHVRVMAVFINQIASLLKDIALVMAAE